MQTGAAAAPPSRPAGAARQISCLLPSGRLRRRPTSLRHLQDGLLGPKVPVVPDGSPCGQGTGLAPWSLMIIAVDVVALWGLCAYSSRENLEAA